MSTAAQILTLSTADQITARLRRLGFKQHGEHWRGNSPFRSNADSESFTVTITGPEHGTWYDFVSDERGSLYDLAGKFGIETPLPPPRVAESSKAAYAGLADYAEKHGAPGEAYIAAGWFETVHNGRKALGFTTGGGATRWRFIDGEKPPYHSPPGYRSVWYGLKRAVKLAAEQDLPLVLVNGEASVVACQHHGIPAAAVTSGGERRIPDALLTELRHQWTGKVIIALDCDAAGRRGAVDLKAQLHDYTTAVVDFELGDGQDAADWCRLHGQKARERLIGKADFQAPADAAFAVPSRYVASETLADQTMRFYTKVFRGEAKLTLPTGMAGWDHALNGGFWSGLNFIAGGQGMGKSTLAASVVGKWTKQGLRGFIVPSEMTPAQWMTRVIAYLARVRTDEIMQMSYGPAAADAVGEAWECVRRSGHVWNTDGSPTVESIRPDLLELVANKRIGFVVIDSSSNLNAPGVSGSIFDQTKAVTNRLNALAREVQAVAGPETPIPFIVVHQTNSEKVDRRATKLATMLDAYGGQSPSQDATTYTALNYHHWFVSRQLAQADPLFPQGVAALIVDKHRFAAGASDAPVRVRFEGGMGFYDDNVPPPAAPAANGKHAAPRTTEPAPVRVYTDPLEREYQDVEF